jgi:hypothetical protein
MIEVIPGSTIKLIGNVTVDGGGAPSSVFFDIYDNTGEVIIENASGTYSDTTGAYEYIWETPSDAPLGECTQRTTALKNSKPTYSETITLKFVASKKSA